MTDSLLADRIQRQDPEGYISYLYIHLQGLISIPPFGKSQTYVCKPIVTF